MVKDVCFNIRAVTSYKACNKKSEKNTLNIIWVGDPFT